MKKLVNKIIAEVVKKKNRGFEQFTITEKVNDRFDVFVLGTQKEFSLVLFMGKREVTRRTLKNAFCEEEEEENEKLIEEFTLILELLKDIY